MNFDPPDFVILSHPRGGTHFLQASLASHPRVHGRGECILARIRGKEPAGPYIFQNKPGCLNCAIVMYQHAADFEDLCGPLGEFKLIHLLRGAGDVAMSVAQMEADRAVLGEAYKAHHRIFRPAPEHAPISARRVRALQAEIASLQKEMTDELRDHPRLLTITYEELTHGGQVNELAGQAAASLLDFLGLEHLPLKNTLRKSAPAQYAFLP